MKRIISVTISVVILLTVLSTVCFAGDSAYWPAQSAYQKATAAGNDTAILAAVKQIEKAYPTPKNAVEYDRVAFPVLKAAQIYEKNTQFDDAVTYYQKFLKYITWLHKNSGRDYHDYLLNIPKVIQHLSVVPEVYAATGKTVCYTGGKYEPKTGTYFGACGNFDAAKQTAILRYVMFALSDGGNTENFSMYNSTLQNVPSDCLIELAWNVPNENINDLNIINSGKRDQYIEDNLNYLKNLKGKILLRFCAEVNCWDNNGSQLAAAFKKAYIRIAKKARAICPNVALVFSPNDVSNRNVTFRDFYPGDQYVDWVGMSSYLNISASAVNTVSGNDAYFCRGLYENQMIKIKDIVDAYGGKKPIMISECGFAYQDGSGRQTTQHAVKKLKEFYGYVNKVYPQVKAVFYFNTNYIGSTNKYLLEGNAEVLAAYNKAIADNESMISSMQEAKRSYVSLDKFGEAADTLTLSTYIYYPSLSKTTVNYRVDGKNAGTPAEAPYSVTVNTKAWAVGKHTITVTTRCGSTTRTVIKNMVKDSKGKITCVSSLRDVKTSHWAYANIEYCLRNNIFSGVSFSAFEPESVMTRAMFVQVLANISGAALTKNPASAFADVKSKDWFAPAVMWAYKHKIVGGVDKKHFAPEEIVTREQMCAMLYRYAKAVNIKMPAKYSAAEFADRSKIGSWAKPSVVACQRAGIINGESINGKVYFNPKDGATRAQAAKVFHIFTTL